MGPKASVRKSSADRSQSPAKSRASSPGKASAASPGKASAVGAVSLGSINGSPSKGERWVVGRYFTDGENKKWALIKNLHSKRKRIANISYVFFLSAHDLSNHIMRFHNIGFEMIKINLFKLMLRILLTYTYVLSMARKHTFLNSIGYRITCS